MATNRTRFDQYTQATVGLRKLVTEALDKILTVTLPLPALEAKEAIETLVGQLVAEYGAIAATLAADYFSLSRIDAGVRTPHRVQKAKPNTDKLGPGIGWALERLFQEVPEPESVTARMHKVVDIAVKETGTDTLALNAKADKAKPRFGRVPVGKTCDFCRMLGSRGFVYASAKSAGELTAFHDKCDCQIVCSWDKEPSLEGYNPDDYKD